MWDEQKRQRFRQLQNQQDERDLTTAEQDELTRLEQEIEALEATYLVPATERIREEIKAIQAQNCELEAMIALKEAEVKRLEAELSRRHADSKN